MTEIYLLSNRDYLKSLSLAAAVLSGEKGELYFIDPLHIEKELEPLLILKERLPFTLINATGTDIVADELNKAGLGCSPFSVTESNFWPELISMIGQPRGICAASAAYPSDCLKAASMAVRLGYYFITDADIGNIGLSLAGDLPLLWFGQKKALEAGAGKKTANLFKIIDDYKGIIDELNSAGLESDYLVLYNSADLSTDSSGGDSLGKLWVRGLSLLLTTLSSYRNVIPYDANTAKPDAAVIEKNLNEMIRESGLKPRFLAVLASPASIPFFYEEKKAVTAWTEEMVRDIHVRLNSDLFFDLSEGRLMQHTTGGLSTQLISTKHYREILNHNGRDGKDVTVVSTPHVESGIIFASDDALMQAQLLPLLEESKYRLKVLQGKESQYSRVGSELSRSDFLLYTGHGGPEGLHTHGHTLNRADLPHMAPLVAYTSACSTVAMVPHWLSVNEGLDWEGIAVDTRQVIGLSFVEKGALCFVGGATIEDLQYSTSIYAIFMEALLVKGLSVGEAVKATRNFISLYAATLLQKNPTAYRKYRWGTANAIHQQVLLGDPAFVPCEEANIDCRLPGGEEHISNGKINISVNIPQDRWRKASTVVNPKEASKHYYRCRNIEVNTPYGENIISWGDYYRVAPDAENISEKGVMSGLIHLTADLLPGQAPKNLRLIEVEADDPFCLLCDNRSAPVENLLEASSKFRLPYLLQPPIELDMLESWAFSAEIRSDHYRLHWLAPLLLINEKARSTIRLKKMVFEIETTPGVHYEGTVLGENSKEGYLVLSGFEGKVTADGKNKDLHINGALLALTEADGSYSILSAGGGKLLIQEQFPLYGLLDNYQVFKSDLIEPKTDHYLEYKLEIPDLVTLNGCLFDKYSGARIPEGLIRIFRGESDPVGDPLIEAFAGETYTKGDGSFSIKLPAGKYLLYAAAAPDGLRYKSAEWPLEIKAGNDCYHLFALDQAALIRGRVTFQGYCPPDPPAVAIKRYPKVEGEGSLSKVPVRRDGTYECLVSFQDRFQITIEEEGYSLIEDTNDSKGYKLGPQEELSRDYVLVREEKES
ncbi:MAG: C25 family cysteine peptidase [Bacillota bacterium]|nr:C25 family cysteine peptidase [Bacillota bacterium]